MKIEDIKIKPHTFEILKWYKNDGSFLGEIKNEHEFNNLRIDLVKNKLTRDCYFMWNDLRIEIDSQGNMSNFPRGLYDHVSIALLELVKLRNLG